MSHLEMEVIGNVGKVEELRTTQNSNSVINFTAASNKQVNGQKMTTWVTITAWNGLAKMLNEHLKVGQLVLIKGEPGVEVWTDEDGKAHSRLKLTAQTFKFLGSKPQ